MAVFKRIRFFNYIVAVIVVLFAATMVVNHLNKEVVGVEEYSRQSSSSISGAVVDSKNRNVANSREKDSESEPFSSGEKKIGVDEAGWHSLQMWKRERGYATPEDEVIYSGYDVPVLAGMAEGGDILAIQELGRRAYNLELGRSVDASVEFALKAYIDAAVRGSTYALTLIGSHELANVGQENDRKKRVDMIMGGLAWYRAAVMRGDVAVEKTHAETFREINNVSLSQDQEDKIVVEAEEILKNLERKREELGLGEYDNSINNIVKLQYEEAISDG